jgi:ABC-type transport system involved in multi-copper enzyme maturation permease subunit
MIDTVALDPDRHVPGVRQHPGFSDTVHSEWLKFWSVRSTGWSVAMLFVLGAGLTALVCGTSAGAIASGEAGEPAAAFITWGLFIAQITALVLGTMVVTSEYGSGMIRATLAATPRRQAVLATKAAVLCATVAVAGTLGVLGSLLAGRILLPGNGFSAANGYPPPSLADPATLRAAVGTVLYLMLVGLLALGVAAAVRSMAGALTIVLSLLFLTPALAQMVTDPVWHDRLARLAPTTAGLAIQATRDLDQLLIAPWAGLGVLAAWAAAALVTGGVLLAARDQ